MDLSLESFACHHSYHLMTFYDHFIIEMRLCSMLSYLIGSHTLAFNDYIYVQICESHVIEEKGTK